MAILAECPKCHRKQKLGNRWCKCHENLDRLKKCKKLQYWIVFWHNGKQHFEKMKGENATSLSYAKDAEGKRRSQKRENKIFDVLAEVNMTFSQLADWYLNLEKVKTLASFSTIKIYLKKFNEQFGNTWVNQIKRSDLENHQMRRRGEGSADRTIDAEIGLAGRAVRLAFEDDIVSGSTLKAFRVKKLLKAGDNARKAVITRDQFDQIMEKLPEHARSLFATAFFTGCRKSEINRLTWSKVDLENRWIRLEGPDTKNKKPRDIPICEELYRILQGIPRAIHDDHVFLYKGKPVGDIRAGLRKACESLGIVYGRADKDGFTFHGCRHTFVTNLRKSGVPASVRMSITGHSGETMDWLYDTVDEDDKRKAMNQMTAFLDVNQTVYQRRN